MGAKKYCVILDLDGTLIDSAGQIYETLLKVVANYDIPEIDYTKFRKCFGLPLIKILENFDIDYNMNEEIVKKFRMELENSIVNGKTHLFDGVTDFLDLLSNKSIKLGIATSKPTYLAEKIIRHSSLKNYDFKLVGTDDTLAKPNPAIINKCKALIGIADGIMVGDSKEDIVAGSLAGLKTCLISVNKGFNSNFNGHSPNYVYKSIRELNSDFARIDIELTNDV